MAREILEEVLVVCLSLILKYEEEERMVSKYTWNKVLMSLTHCFKMSVKNSNLKFNNIKVSWSYSLCVKHFVKEGYVSFVK